MQEGSEEAETEAGSSVVTSSSSTPPRDANLKVERPVWGLDSCEICCVFFKTKPKLFGSLLETFDFMLFQNLLTLPVAHARPWLEDLKEYRS